MMGTNMKRFRLETDEAFEGVPTFIPDRHYRILGKGTYNCVILEIATNHVFRVGQLGEDGTRLHLFQRATGIMELLEQSRHMIGPYFLAKPTYDGVVHFESLPAEMQELVRNCGPTTGLKAGDNVNVQQIEYLESSFAGEDVDAVTFMLMWFFFTASALFGFRHGDLKPGNIMFRHLAAPKTQVFHVQPDYYFQITTSYEPVVIDYELGSIFLTNSVHRNDIGTYAFAPPEVLFFKATSDAEPPGRESYDFYSLGISLLMYVPPRGFGKILFEPPPKDLSYKSFRAKIRQKYGMKQTPEAKQFIFLLYNHMRILYKLELLKQATLRELIPYMSVMVDVISMFLKDYKTVVDTRVNLWYENLYFFERDSPTKTIILQLLSIHPMSRIHEGNVWSVIADAFPFSSQDMPSNYSMPKLKVFDMSTDQNSRITQITVMNRALQRYHALATHIECAGCASPDVSHVDSNSGRYYCSPACYKATCE